MWSACRSITGPRNKATRRCSTLAVLEFIPFEMFTFTGMPVTSHASLCQFCNLPWTNGSMWRFWSIINITYTRKWKFRSSWARASTFPGNLHDVLRPSIKRELGTPETTTRHLPTSQQSQASPILSQHSKSAQQTNTPQLNLFIIRMSNTSSCKEILPTHTAEHDNSNIQPSASN